MMMGGAERPSHLSCVDCSQISPKKCALHLRDGILRLPYTTISPIRNAFHTMFRTPASVRFLAVFSIAFIASLGASAANQIVVRSQAKEDYLRARALADNNGFQTYHFMKGNYHPGGRGGNSMEKLDFMEIATDVATHLKRQKYFPAGEGNQQADLVIVLHWGATSTVPTNDDLLGYTSLEDKLGSSLEASQGNGGEITSSQMNSVQDVQFQANADLSNAEGNELSERYQAELIGMGRAYSENISQSEEFGLKFLLQDDRYFIALIAYDYQMLKVGEIEPVWETRYSVRATGQSFEDAIKDLNLMAGNYFGQDHEDLIKKRITDKTRVKLGELELVGTEELEEEATSSANE